MRKLVLPVLSILLAACASAGTPPPEAPEPEGEPEARPAGVPGFDTRHYPGRVTMDRWREDSPYRWVGFYLPAPCYTGTTWQGRRSELVSGGWGLAVLFVGEQDWAHAAPGAAEAVEPPDTLAGGEPRCTSGNLSRERGATDGAAAVDATREEGFPSGTTIYLDVERVEEVSGALAGYVTGWSETVAGSSYVPGLYAHLRNADALAEAARSGAGRPPRVWVTGGGGFSLTAWPGDSGHPDAWIWQGALDVEETWGGVGLRIDRNTARTSDPSAGGG